MTPKQAERVQYTLPSLHEKVQAMERDLRLLGVWAKLVRRIGEPSDAVVALGYSARYLDNGERRRILVKNRGFDPHVKVMQSTDGRAMTRPRAYNMARLRDGRTVVFSLVEVDEDLLNEEGKLCPYR